MRSNKFHIFTTKARADAYVAKVEQQLGYPLPARKPGGDIDPAGEQTTRFAVPMKNKTQYAVREEAGVAAASVMKTMELDDDWQTAIAAAVELP